MPFISLNKVISLFLVGTFSLGLMLGFMWPDLRNKAGAFDAKSLEPWIGLLSFTGIVLAFILGLVVNAIANRLVRRVVIFRAARNERAARALLSDKDYRTFVSWKAWFVAMAKDHPAISRKPTSLPDSEADSKQLATTICIQHGAVHGFEWLTSHFSMHYFASDISFLLLAGCLVPVKLALSGSISISLSALSVVTLLVASYFTLCFSLGQYLYTYTFTYRVATLYLSENIGAGRNMADGPTLISISAAPDPPTAPLLATT